MKVPPVAIDHNPRHGKTPYLWTHPRNQDLVKLIPDTPYYIKVATIIRYKPEHKDSIIDCIGNAIKVSKQVIVVTNTQGGRYGRGNIKILDLDLNYKRTIADSTSLPATIIRSFNSSMNRTI